MIKIIENLKVIENKSRQKIGNQRRMPIDGL